MSQTSITSFYKAKKRPIQSPDDRVKSAKVLASESNRVQFVKKGNLSPVKKNPNEPVKFDLKKAKNLAKSFHDAQEKLEKLRAARKKLEELKPEPVAKEPELEITESKEKDVDGKISKDQKDRLPAPTEAKNDQGITTAVAPPIPILVDANPLLKLPQRLKVLKMLHEGMNSVSSMFQNRSETITFSKLKPAVESMTKHTFNLKSVARMLSVDSSFFKVVVQRVDNVNQYVIEYQIKLLPSQLVRLRKTFEARLFNYCLIEHEKFLLTQNIEVDRQLVTRWHPSFDIESVQIPPAQLPELKEKLSSAAEILMQVRNMVQSKKQTPPNSPVKPKQASVKEMKGISASLLQKIREREKNRIVRDLTIPQAEINLRKMKSRLPEMARIIHNLFVGEKKAAIEMPRFLERLQFSYGALSASEVNDHVQYLMKNYPQWIQKIKSSSCDYIKIDRNVQINSLVF